MLQKSYVPLWFKIKSKTSIGEGSKHLYELKRSRYSNAELRKLGDVVIQQNAFFAHEENLFLAMLNNDKESIGQLVLQRILAI